MSDHSSENLDTPTSPGIQRGVVTGWEDGYPLVLVSGKKVSCRGRLLASVREQQVDLAIEDQLEVLLQFVQDESTPYIMGVVMPPRDESIVDKSIQIDKDGECLTLTADREIVLRCGDASIRLSQNGKIQVKGLDITTRAQRNNRIRGGNVLIN